MRVYRLALEFFTELRGMQVYEEDLMEACTQYWMNESEYYKMIKRRGQYRKKSSSTTSMEEVGEKLVSWMPICCKTLMYLLIPMITVSRTSN